MCSHACHPCSIANMILANQYIHVTEDTVDCIAVMSATLAKHCSAKRVSTRTCSSSSSSSSSSSNTGVLHSTMVEYNRLERVEQTRTWLAMATGTQPGKKTEPVTNHTPKCSAPGGFMKQHIQRHAHCLACSNVRHHGTTKLC